MYKLKNINGQKVRYFSKNNNSKWTVLFVHGFNSSSIFAKNLFTLKNEYNIIAIDMVDPESKKDVEYSNLVTIVNHFVKKIRTTKLILLGHSLAGGVVSKVGLHPKVRKIVYMSTITPELANTKGFKFLKNHHKPKSKIALMFSNKIEEKAKDKYEWVHTFLDRDSIWANILHETAFNEEFMKKLDKRYKLTRHKSHFIVGKDDSVINTKVFCNYVNELKQNPQIVGIRHNPIKTAPNEVNEILNMLAKGNKRRFKKSLIW